MTVPKPSLDERILVLAPTGRDGSLISGTLQQSGFEAVLCPTIDSFCKEVELGGAVGAMTEEALTQNGLAELQRFLSLQEPWSDFPFVIFASRATSEHGSAERYERLKRLRNFTIFERPIYPVTMVTAIDSALRARRRQYEARAYFAERKRHEERIAEMNRDLEQRVALRTKELAKTQEAFYESQKLEAIGRLAGGVAHDFNNLITGIIGLTEEARDAMPADNPYRQDLDEVVKAARRASVLTRQLLAFGRKQVVSQRVINLNAVISETTRIFEKVLGADIQTELNMDPALGNVRADPGQIEQILMNLVLNARDAMPRGGKLTLETRNDTWGGKPYVRISVADTGCGIPAEHLTQIFEPFFTTKERGKGTGLGLPMVFGIVKQNGGEVDVQTQLNEGTTFTIYLPQVNAKMETEVTYVSRSAPGGSETILLAEDEEIVRRIARRALQKAGYTVLEASTGEEALQIATAKGAKIDMLLTDVVMPGLNGRDLARSVLNQRPDLPVLYMSGYAQDIIVERGIIEPGIEFIEKSFSPTTLCRRVRDVLDSNR